MNDEEQPKKKKKKPAQNIEIIPPTLPAKKKTGRPSQYTEETANKICELLARGMSLNEICESGKYPEMPGLNAVYNWLRAQPSFAQNYTRAKEDSADTYAASIIDAVRGPFDDMVQVNAARLKVDALKWIVAKLKPRSYGERVEATLTGPNGGPIQVQAVPLDASILSPEAREVLRQVLLTNINSDDEVEDD